MSLSPVLRVVRSPLLLLTLAFFLVRVLVSLTRTGPLVVADEIGYLANARVLSGGTPGQLTLAAFTHGGYSLLLAPVLAVFGNPFTAYRVVLVVNAALAASLVPLLYALVRTLVTVDRRVALGAAALAAAYPSVTILSQFAMSENLLYPALAAWLVAAANLLVTRTRPVLWSVVFGALTAVLFATHGRMVVAIGLAPLLLLGALRFRVVGVRAVVGALAVLGAGLVGERVLDNYLADRNFGGGSDEVSQRLDAFHNGHAASVVARNLVGQSWYLLVASLGLPVAAVLVARARRDVIRPGAVAVFALLAVTAAGLVVVSALSFLDDYRPDQFVYGRYTEVVVPCVLAPALALVVPALRTVRLTRILALLVAASAVAALLRATLHPSDPANRLNVSALPVPPFDLQAVTLLLAGAAAAFWLVCLALAGRRRASLAWLVVAVAFAAPTLNTLRNPVLTGEDQVYGGGWTSPGEAVDQRLPVAYDTTHADLLGLYAYQWFFDHARYRLVSGRPAPGFRGYFVTAPGGRAAGRLVWQDPNRPQAIYALGGAPVAP
jgi:hypothetical protein